MEKSIEDKIEEYKAKASLIGIKPLNLTIESNGIHLNNCSWAQTEKIPDFVTHIDNSAFEGNEYIENITIGENIVYLGNGAFKDCEKLKEVEMYNSLKVLYSNTFEYCKRLREIELPKDLEEIQAEVFYFCISLKTIKLPDKLRLIGRGSFSYCIGLETIEIPKSVEEIGTNTFWECGSLEELRIDGNIKSLKGAIQSCEKLKRVFIRSDNIVDIDENFYMCERLESIEINCKTKNKIGYWILNNLGVNSRVTIRTLRDNIAKELKDNINNLSINIEFID